MTGEVITLSASDWVVCPDCSGEGLIEDTEGLWWDCLCCGGCGGWWKGPEVSGSVVLPGQSLTNETQGGQ